MKPLPLTEPVLPVLLSLAEQPRHGYSILKDVERISGGRVKLSTGTRYGALRRLLDEVCSQTNAFEFAKSFPAALWLLPNIAELIAPARAKPFKT